MKNVFWDIKSQFVPHRRHITSRLQSRENLVIFYPKRLFSFTSPIPDIFITEAIRSSEASVLTEPHGVRSQKAAFFNSS
jgi:hypothetical protein